MLILWLHDQFSKSNNIRIYEATWRAMYVYQKFECTHTYVIIYEHTYVATYFILYTVHACKHAYFLGSFISFEDNGIAGSSVSMLKTDVILHTTYYLLYMCIHIILSICTSTNTYKPT